MNSIFLTIFILIANIIAIALLYYVFGKNIEKNKKLIYIMIAVGIMYIIILIIYWLSSIGIGNKTVSDNSKNFITFTFVPVNTIIILPYLIYSFGKKKNNEITMEQLNKRTIIVLIIAVILIIFEFFYFRNIQKGIIELVEQKQSNEVETTEENLENNVENNLENTENNQESIIDDINNTENVIENLY
jgi:hypothetical protein